MRAHFIRSITIEGERMEKVSCWQEEQMGLERD